MAVIELSTRVSTYDSDILRKFRRHSWTRDGRLKAKNTPRQTWTNKGASGKKRGILERSGGRIVLFCPALYPHGQSPSLTLARDGREENTKWGSDVRVY